MRFSAEILRQGGKPERLEVDALDADQARRRLLAEGCAVLRIKPLGAGGGWLRRTRAFPLVLFCQELLALLRAGLSIVEGLETLAEKESQPEARAILDGLLGELRQGKGFSAALSVFPAQFPALLVATVRASERTGDLDEAIDRFIAYEIQLDLVRKKIVSASIYPTLLIIIGGLVTLFLLGYVVPRFSSVYQDAGKELPAMSAALIVIGNFLAHNWLAILIAVIAASFLFMHGVRSGAVGNGLRRVCRQVPLLDEKLRVFSLARCYRTLGMLQRGGIPLSTGMEMVAGLLAGEMRQNLVTAQRLVSEGVPYSVAAEQAGLVTPIATRLLRVGEKGGNLGEMMERIAVFYDDDIQRWTDQLIRLIEPLLMAVIGIVIGGVVVLLYLPIFELASGIQ
jgi:general secretion pathway protein F